MSVFAVEYPGYGPAEGVPGQETVNDNALTAFNFLTLIMGYAPEYIVMMGYSVGTGATIELAAHLCETGRRPAALVALSAFSSICDVVNNLRGSLFVSSLADSIANHWYSLSHVASITCPSIFLHGEKDDVIPHEHSHRLYTFCGASKKVLVTIPNATHTMFEEPTDTILPIATFLAENLQVKTNLHSPLTRVPTSYLSCPKRVIEREKLTANMDLPSSSSDSNDSRYVYSYEDTSGSDPACDVSFMGEMFSSLTSIFDPAILGLTMIDQNKQSGTFDEVSPVNSSFLVTSSNDAFDDSSLRRLGEEDESEFRFLDDKECLRERFQSVTMPFLTLSRIDGSTIESGQYGMHKSRSVRRGSVERLLKTPSSTDIASPRSNIISGSNSTSTNSVAGAGSGTPRKAPPLSYTKDSLDRLLKCNKTEENLTAEMKQVRLEQRDKALKCLEGYMSALNSKDPRRVLKFLDTDVMVRYTNSKFNWSSTQKAYKKYSDMYKKMPGFEAKHSVVEIVQEKSVVTIVTLFEATCYTGLSRCHTVAYVIQGSKIFLIDNQ